MADYAELIGRLEKATGPDRELDADIWVLDARLPRHLAYSHPAYTPAHYTQSIDAALTLLPEWASYELSRSAAGEPTFTRCRLWDWRRGPLAIDRDNEWKSEGNRTLPHNIIIAALKAIALTAGKGGGE